MKKYCLLAIGLLGLMQAGFCQNATPPHKDSVVILFGNKTKMILYSEEKGGIRSLQKYDFNEILKDVGIFMEDARNKETYLYINESTGRRYLKDTTLAVSKEEPSPEPTDSTVVKKDTTTRADNDDDDDDYNDYDDNDDDHFFNRISFTMDGGFNTYMLDGKAPARFDSPYGLRPLGSRYVAFSLLENSRIGGKNSPFYIRWGVELAWNNFMMEGNNQVVKTPTGVAFPEVRDFEKSKLTVSYLSIPVIPTLQFRNSHGKKLFRLGAGGYAGLRLGSHTKVKYNENDNTIREKDHSDFYLNDFRYGVMAQVGIRWLTFFAKYDLNPLFADNKGPQLRTLSFGITLFDF